MPEVVTLTARRGMPKAGLVTGVSRNKVAVLEGAAGSPPFQGELKKRATSELSLEMEVFFRFSTVK